MISKHFVSSDVRLRISETNLWESCPKGLCRMPQQSQGEVCRSLGSPGPAPNARAPDSWKLVSLELFWRVNKAHRVSLHSWRARMVRLHSQTFINLQVQGLNNSDWLRLIVKEIKYFWHNRAICCETPGKSTLSEETWETVVLWEGSSGGKGGKCLLSCCVKVSCDLPALAAETMVPKWIVSLYDLEMTVMSVWCRCWSLLSERCIVAIAKELLVLEEASVSHSLPSSYL